MTAGIELMREHAAELRAIARKFVQMARDLDDEIVAQEGFAAIIAPCPEQTALSRSGLLARAEATYKARRRREKLLGSSLFGEPGWDMLLDLYANRLKGRRVAVTSLCLASAVPNTTALRWIKQLEAAGLIVKTAYPHDARVQHLALSDRGYHAMTTYFSGQSPDETAAAAIVSTPCRQNP